MKIINAKTKNELIEELGNINAADMEVYLSLRPTIEIISKLTEQSPKIQKIMCPHSLYLQVSRRTFKKLAELNIMIQPGDVSVGRPMKHDPSIIRKVINERAAGRSAKQISIDNEIPLRTVYYYLKNGLKTE